LAAAAASLFLRNSWLLPGGIGIMTAIAGRDSPNRRRPMSVPLSNGRAMGTGQSGVRVAPNQLAPSIHGPTGHTHRQKRRCCNSATAPTISPSHSIPGSIRVANTPAMATKGLSAGTTADTNVPGTMGDSVTTARTKHIPPTNHLVRPDLGSLIIREKASNLVRRLNQDRPPVAGESSEPSPRPPRGAGTGLGPPQPQPRPPRDRSRSSSGSAARDPPFEVPH
jgi:hypothetical protein